MRAAHAALVGPDAHLATKRLHETVDEGGVVLRDGGRFPAVEQELCKLAGAALCQRPVDDDSAARDLIDTVSVEDEAHLLPRVLSRGVHRDHLALLRSHAIDRHAPVDGGARHLLQALGDESLRQAVRVPRIGAPLVCEALRLLARLTSLGGAGHELLPHAIAPHALCLLLNHQPRQLCLERQAAQQPTGLWPRGNMRPRAAEVFFKQLGILLLEQLLVGRGNRADSRGGFRLRDIAASVLISRDPEASADEFGTERAPLLRIRASARIACAHTCT